jgi:hypothetical protein
MSKKKTTQAKATKSAKATKPVKKAKAPKEKKVSAIDAAAKVLAGAKDPMTAKELIDAMAKQALWTSPGGKTPHATLYSAIIREIAVKGKEARFTKTERGKFAAKQAAQTPRRRPGRPETGAFCVARIRGQPLRGANVGPTAFLWAERQEKSGRFFLGRIAAISRPAAPSNVLPLTPPASRCSAWHSFPACG